MASIDRYDYVSLTVDATAEVRRMSGQSEVKNATHPTLPSGPATPDRRRGEGTLRTHFHDTSTEGFELVGEVVRIGSASAFLNGEIRCAESNNLLTSAKGHWRVYER
jgi:acyl-coenzyme A thioesterase PaaI-like protein